jgi:hypothetical protein
MSFQFKRLKSASLSFIFILLTTSVFYPIIHFHAHDVISHEFGTSENNIRPVGSKYCKISPEGHGDNHHKNHAHLISESRPISRQSNLFEHFIIPTNAIAAEILFLTGKPLKTLPFQRNLIYSNNGFFAAFSGLSPPAN